MENQSSSRALSAIAMVCCASSGCATDERAVPVERRQHEFPGATEPIANCDAAGAFTTEITNPYYPLPPCTRRVYEAVEQGVTAAVRITVLDEIAVVNGVDVRVIEEYETEGDTLVEISRNYFAQAVGGGVPPGASSPRDGTVCYFGEHVDIFDENGNVTHEGQWLAGVDGALPGIIMPGRVAKGQAYLQEVAPGVAEDRAWHVQLASGHLTVDEDTPLDPGAISHKVYGEGIGLVRDGKAKLVSQEVLADCDDDDRVR